MYSIEEFRANLGNIVRPNKFLVYVFPPAIVNSELTTEDMVFYAQSAVIPDRSFNEIAIKFYGMEYKIPGSEILQDLVINFIVEENWNIRDFFESWSQAINDRGTGLKGYTEELFKDTWIEIYQLGFNNETLARYIFKHIYPKTVDQIELNQETFDTIETFQVTFAYSYWERLEITE